MYGAQVELEQNHSPKSIESYPIINILGCDQRFSIVTAYDSPVNEVVLIAR
jgi:hypothetical protein